LNSSATQEPSDTTFEQQQQNKQTDRLTEDGCLNPSTIRKASRRAQTQNRNCGFRTVRPAERVHALTKWTRCDLCGQNANLQPPACAINNVHESITWC